jgi:DNA-binding winged helix-turn-helix (wHTH) protein
MHSKTTRSTRIAARFLKADRPVAVQPQVFPVLAFLIANRGRAVTKDEMIKAVWDGRIVSESTLTSRINAARIAVGDSGEDQRLMKTASRKGFRFVGAVREMASTKASAELPSADVLTPWRLPTAGRRACRLSCFPSRILAEIRSQIRGYFVIARHTARRLAFRLSINRFYTWSARRLGRRGGSGQGAQTGPAGDRNARENRDLGCRRYGLRQERRSFGGCCEAQCRVD